MIPSYRWFPTNLSDRILWFANFAAQFKLLAALLGLEGKIPQVDDDNSIMQFLGQADTASAAFNKGVEQYTRNMTENPFDATTAQFPDNPTLEPPKVVPPGIFERLNKLVDQIESADGYTTEIGAQLGILPKGKDTTKPEDKKPTLKGQTFPAQQIQVEFVRGGTDGVNLHIAVDGGEQINMGNFPKSPAVFNVPGDATKPHKVEIVGRYLKGNTPIGQNSDEIKLVSQP